MHFPPIIKPFMYNGPSNFELMHLSTMMHEHSLQLPCSASTIAEQVSGD